ncbi:MAG TPA: glutamine amidotransferase [Tepidisphaeraceae bacterium]|nr:glutamine amidotransferase [Tepidisphaeraceae bacterium]
MESKHILYCGDTSLTGAAAYLAGLMTRFGLGFEYVPSDRPLTLDQARRPGRKLFVVSDYPSSHMAPAVQGALLEQVVAGAGLLMIGGWESFHGHGGNWDGTPVAAALPVEIQAEDDRINCDQPALLIRAEEHEIVAELPWSVRPPTVGGFNRVSVKPGSATILLVQQFQAVFEGGRFNFVPQQQHPMLVLGAHGAGRTAALMTDLAPHWVGGLVDWGDDERVTAQAPGGAAVEVGNFYAQLVVNLLAWTGKFHGQRVD